MNEDPSPDSELPPETRVADQPAATQEASAETDQTDSADDAVRWAESLGEEEAVAALAALGRRFLRHPALVNYFSTWETHGFHLLPNHFYMPVPDTRFLGSEVWERPYDLTGVDMRDEAQLDLLRSVFPSYRPEYDGFAHGRTEGDWDFYFDNDFFGGTDALVSYCLIRHLRPRRIVEVGSGFSTRIALRALQANGDGSILCVEPFPDEVLRRGLPQRVELLQQPVETVPLETFTSLETGDVLFIDSSHVIRIGGDVTHLFLKVLPHLKPGVAVHVHDVFLPCEYPREWLTDHLRFWDEQYLLHAFLLFNREWEVLFANTYMATRHGEEMRTAFPRSPWWGGGSFWLRRAG